ncbi:MAG: menaquinone biosynthetic enzyme MqnA/MqnD family protein [Terriglobales bacterium]
MRKLLISAISFLNTAPLMWDFELGVPPRYSGGQLADPKLQRDFAVEYTVPSKCAEALEAGTADIGIIPAVMLARIPGLVILPDVAIASQGPVRSILLVSKVPLEQVRTLAADTSSRTSVVLARVLFRLWFGRAPEFAPAAPYLAAMLADCDAALLIGDAALMVDRSRYQSWDLADEWRRLTGRPFVFAVWAVRLAALGEMRTELDLPGVFRRSRDHGLEPENLRTIARCWAPRVRLSEAEIVEYLTRNIDFNLDDENLAGLELFFHHAARFGEIPAAPALRFLGGLRESLAAISG